MLLIGAEHLPNLIPDYSLSGSHHFSVIWEGGGGTEKERSREKGFVTVFHLTWVIKTDISVKGI